MTGLFSPSIPKRATPNAPSPADPALAVARDATTSAAANVYGRGATLLTGGTGVPAPAVTSKKTLLGGGG